MATWSQEEQDALAAISLGQEDTLPRELRKSIESKVLQEAEPLMHILSKTFERMDAHPIVLMMGLLATSREGARIMGIDRETWLRICRLVCDAEEKEGRPETGEDMKTEKDV